MGRLTVAAIEKYKATTQRREIADGGGLYLTIQPRPSGAKGWALRYRRPDGRPAKLVLGSVDLSGHEPEGRPQIGTPLSLRAARALAADQLRDRARGVDVAAKHLAEKARQRATVGNGGNNFSVLVRAFIDQHCRVYNRRWLESASLFGVDYPEDGKAEPTLRRNGLCDRWRHRDLRDITSDELHDIVVEAQRTGVPGRPSRHDGPSDSRGRALAAALSKFCSWAKEHRHISVNPALDLFFPAPGKARTRTLNCKLDVRRADELRWLWKGCDRLSEPFGSLLKVLLLSGMRLHELSELTVEEVSDDCTTLRIPAERTKNHKAFEVYLPPLARELLTGVKRFDGSRYIFSTNGRTPVSGWSKIKRQLDEAMSKFAREEHGGDFTIPDWRIHDLRRTCATGMHSLGVPPHIVEACLNHVSGHRAGVAGVYNQEQYSKEKKAAWARWAGHVDSIINGAPSNVLPFAVSAGV
jgi:integrase